MCINAEKYSPNLEADQTRSRFVSGKTLRKELGVDSTTYVRYENGSTNIKFDHVFKLATMYKMSLDELVNYGEKISSAQPLYSKTKTIAVTQLN